MTNLREERQSFKHVDVLPKTQMTLGEKIYKLRKEHGWAQDYIAEKVNVSRQAVSRWELDESVPDMENLLKLSELFSVTIDTLIKSDQYVNKEETESIKSIPKRKSDANRTKNISIILSVIGFLIIGILCFMSTVIPSYIESESVVTKDDIYFIDPNTEMTVPEYSVVTTNVEAYELSSFLSTYHLHWLFISGCFLIIYGVVSYISLKLKKDTKERKGTNDKKSV